MPPTPESTRRFDRLPLGLVLGLFVFALGLRCLGLGWGLPNARHNQSYHPDELVIFAYSQEIEPRSFDFDPGFYNYGTLYLTTLRVASDVVSGYMGGPDRDAPWKYIGRVHRAGRFLSALAGAGTVVFVFLLLRRRTNLLGASLGAAAMAVAPGHVVHSRFQTVDVAATFFLAAALYFALEILVPPATEGEQVRKRSDVSLAVLSGVFAGLSAGTKYTGILALLALVTALWLARRPGWVQTALKGVGAAFATFVVGTPGVLLNTGKFLEDVKFEMLHTSTGHGLVFAGYPNGFVTHSLNIALGLGVIVAVLGMLGLGGAAFRKRPWAWALLAFALPYALLIGRAEVMFLRYTFPLVVVLAVGFGALAGWAHAKRGWATGAVALAIIGLGGMDGGGARGAMVMTSWMLEVDPRDACAEYVQGLASAEPNLYTVGIVSDPWFYTPSFYQDTGLPRAMPFLERDKFRWASFEPRVAQFLPENPEERFAWDARLVTETRPEVIVYSSFEWNDVARLKGRAGLAPEIQVQVDRAAEFHAALERDYVLDRVFGVPTVPIHDLQYIRPSLWVWKRKD